MSKKLERVISALSLIPLIARCSATPIESSGGGDADTPATPTETSTSMPTNTTEPTAANTSTAEATETVAASKFNIEFPSDHLQKLSNEERDSVIKIIRDRYECISESCDMEVFVSGNHTTLVFKSGEIFDQDTKKRYTQPVTLIKFYGDTVPVKFKGALLKIEGSNTVALYEMKIGGNMELTGIILHADGVRYKLGLVQNPEGNILYALTSDLGGVHYLTVDANNPSKLTTEFITNGVDVVVKIPNPDVENSGSVITVEEAKTRALNPLEQIKIQYDVDSANFKSSTFFSNYRAWRITENNITDKQTGEKFGVGDYIIFTEDGPIAVHVNFDLDKVIAPPGYMMEWKIDEQNGLKVTAVFLSNSDESDLVWDTETKTWEEETKEYASAGEALVALGIQEGWSNTDRSIRFLMHTDSWLEYKDKTGFEKIGPFRLPEGVDEKEVERIINDFLLEGVQANDGNIAARRIDTNEFIITNVLTEDGKLDPKFKFITITGVGKKETPHVQLPLNPGAERLFLPLKSNGNSTGSQYGIFFIPETNTFVVYTEVHWQRFTQESHEDSNAARMDMMGSTHPPLLALSLLTIPPDKMEQFLNIKEYAERKDLIIFSDFFGASTAGWQMQRDLHDLAQNTTIWKIWD